MKTKLLFACTLITVNLCAQNLNTEFGMAYNFMAPMGTMKNYIKAGHGLSLDYYMSRENSRFAFGAELNFVIYGHDKSEQLYTFPDGSTANMDIVVDNTITNLFFGSRYFLREPSSFRPFLSAKVGYSWYRTNLNIYDPDDFDNCEPVERDLLFKDGTFVLAGGAGFQYDLSSIFKKIDSDRFLFTLNATFALGGQVTYMSIDSPTHHAPAKNDVHSSFINTQTQVIHKHHIGYLYSSAAELVEVRAGFIFRRMNAWSAPLRIR